MLKGLETQSRGNSDQAPVLRDLQQGRRGRLNGAVGDPTGGTFFFKKLAELHFSVGRSTVRASLKRSIMVCACARQGANCPRHWSGHSSFSFFFGLVGTLGAPCGKRIGLTLSGHGLLFEIVRGRPANP